MINKIKGWGLKDEDVRKEVAKKRMIIEDDRSAIIFIKNINKLREK